MTHSAPVVGILLGGTWIDVVLGSYTEHQDNRVSEPGFTATEEGTDLRISGPVRAIQAIREVVK